MANKVSFIVNRARTFFYNGEVLCCNNGNFQYRKVDGKWYVEQPWDVSTIHLKKVSVGLSFEIEKLLAQIPDANIQRYPASTGYAKIV